MTMTDPIADMLARIRNATVAAHEVVQIPMSRQKLEIARILKEQGYISDFTTSDADSGHKQIQVTLKYGPDRARTIQGMRRISKPGLRVYAQADRLPKVLGGMGTAILSTSSGVMTDREARRRRVGGEVIAYIW